MIKLSVAQLEHEVVHLKGEEPATILELGDNSFYEAIAPLRYDLTAKMVSGGVLVSGLIETVIAGECGRCLVPVESKIVNDDVCLFFENVESPELDITEDVREEMLVELPMNLLCSEDCAGLCPKCGANLNFEECHCAEAASENMAWDALDSLKF